MVSAYTSSACWMASLQSGIQPGAYCYSIGREEGRGSREGGRRQGEGGGKGRRREGEGGRREEGREGKGG